MHKKINLLFVLSLLFTTAQHCADGNSANDRSEGSRTTLTQSTSQNTQTETSEKDSAAAIRNLARTNYALTMRNFELENQNKTLMTIIQESPERIAQYAPEQHRLQPALRTATTASSNATAENTNLKSSRRVQFADRNPAAKKSSWVSKLLWFTTGAATTLVVYHNKERIKDFATHHARPIQDFIANRTTGCSTAMLDVISGKPN